MIHFAHNMRYTIDSSGQHIILPRFGRIQGNIKARTAKRPLVPGSKYPIQLIFKLIIKTSGLVRHRRFLGRYIFGPLLVLSLGLKSCHNISQITWISEFLLVIGFYIIFLLILYSFMYYWSLLRTWGLTSVIISSGADLASFELVLRQTADEYSFFC